jgi:hypothetical protein
MAERFFHQIKIGTHNLPRHYGRSPELAAFVTQNGPPDRFARLKAVVAHSS